MCFFHLIVYCPCHCQKYYYTDSQTYFSDCYVNWLQVSPVIDRDVIYQQMDGIDLHKDAGMDFSEYQMQWADVQDSFSTCF
uniref:NEK5 n=1 Tax=Arundo donax TaxID=35708 RepID=A0A0A9CV73_ARUDO